MELSRPERAWRVIRELAFRLDLPATTLLRTSGAERAYPIYSPGPGLADDAAQESGGGGA